MGDVIVMKTEKSRWDRFKKWTKKHQDAIFVTGTIGTIVVGIIAIVKVDNAARERSTAELNARIDELNSWQQEERMRELEEGIKA
jgi:hypothetical protein